MDNTNKIKAFEELQKVRNKYEGELEDDDVFPTSGSIAREISRLKQEEAFGFKLQNRGGGHYGVPDAFDDWSLVLYFNEEGERKISWSDDGRQPENEWLYVISFGTGAYIFGQSYPEETFRSFFTELKQFEPKYCDTANKSLYFTPDKAKAVHESFWEIFNRHKAMVEGELKKKRKAKLLEELKTLEEME